MNFLANLTKAAEQMEAKAIGENISPFDAAEEHIIGIMGGDEEEIAIQEPGSLTTLLCEIAAEVGDLSGGVLLPVIDLTGNHGPLDDLGVIEPASALNEDI